MSYLQPQQQIACRINHRPTTEMWDRGKPLEGSGAALSRWSLIYVNTTN